MHEWGLIRAAAAELAAATGDVALARVVVHIGPGVDGAAAAAAWETEVRGGAAGDLGDRLASAEVRWEQAQHTLSCLSCGCGYCGDALSPCPACGGNGLVMEPAAEIAIAEWVPYDGDRAGDGG